MKNKIIIVGILIFALTINATCAAEDDKFCGLGISFVKDIYMGNCVITDVIQNSPADFAGLKVGDRIKKIDNFSTYNFFVGVSQEKIFNKLQGDAGTKVTLLYRDNDNVKQIKTIERGCFNMPQQQPKKKEQVEFEKYWYQVAPVELGEFKPFNPLAEKYLSKYFLDIEFPGYFEAKEIASYWEGRKKQFKIGYNTCFDYSASEKNGCLQNLIGREILKTQHNDDYNLQLSIARMQNVNSIMLVNTLNSFKKSF